MSEQSTPVAAAASAKSSQRPAGYRIQLDGLRAVAVTATVIHHWVPDAIFWKTWFPFGVAGVRLFFVLSGFLITSILLDQRFAVESGEQDRATSLGHFFLRRVMRLVPAFYLFLLVGSALDIGAIRDTVLWHIPYLSNLGMILDGRWLPSITHLWSLAVEEQFYIAWAFLMLWLPRGAILPCIGLSIVAAPVFRTLGVALGWADMTISFNPISCLDTLGMGALLAVLWRGDVHARATSYRERFVRVSLIVGLPLLLVTIVGQKLAGEAFRRSVAIPIQESAMAMVFTWLVARATVGFGGPAGRFFANPLVVRLGVMSYAVYLFHPAVANAVMRWFSVGWSYWPTVGFSAFLTLSLAWLSWEFLEEPARKYGRRFAYVERTPKPAE
ncbi:MAG: acyltransferase [Myxococcota bacterium]|jgi:peptidoglycan/LPS O-acetylase OafA/YrhL|nr:acyltransferase [Myxococcota bacterium]